MIDATNPAIWTDEYLDAQLEAKRAEVEALNAEKARQENEPDWEAWEAAWQVFDAERSRQPDYSRKSTIRALIAAYAAAPLIPTPEIDVEGLAQKCLEAWTNETTSLSYGAYTIRETIRLLGHVPKREGDGWIEWHGGECPVPAGTRVEVRFGVGRAITDTPEHICWRHNENPRDIIAYRLLREKGHLA